MYDLNRSGTEAQGKDKNLGKGFIKQSKFLKGLNF